MAKLLCALPPGIKVVAQGTEWPKDNPPPVFWELLSLSSPYLKELFFSCSKAMKRKQQTNSAPRVDAEEWVSRLPWGKCSSSSAAFGGALSQSSRCVCDACLLGKSPKHKVFSSLPTAGVQETMELPIFCGRQTWALNHVNNLPESSRQYPNVLGAAAVGWGGVTTVSKEFEFEFPAP